MTSQAQLRRLLSLVPYLREHDGVAMTEVAAAFGITLQTLREDLSVLWMCGLPGLTPGDLIDIDMDAVDGEGVIHLSNADYLTRPLRLSADEALALVLALRTLREIAGPGDQEAADRALKKLEAASGNVVATDQASVCGHRGPRRHPGPGQRRPAARQAARPHLRCRVPGRDHAADGRSAAGLRARGVRLPGGLVLLGRSAADLPTGPDRRRRSDRNRCGAAR